jgi:hypothetical protein
MSTRTANRAKQGNKQQTITRRRKPQVVKAAQKSKTVNLAVKAQKVNSVQFSGKGLITGLYVRKSVLALLDSGQKTVDVSFAPHSGDQPINSLRFTEQGEQSAIGSLYLMRAEIAKLNLGITAKSSPRVRLQRNGKTGIKVTVSA